MMDQRRYGLWCGLGAIDGRLQIDDDRKQRFQNITLLTARVSVNWNNTEQQRMDGQSAIPLYWFYEGQSKIFATWL